MKEIKFWISSYEQTKTTVESKPKTFNVKKWSQLEKKNNMK